MIKAILILFLSIFLLKTSYGQDEELKLYKNIYSTADSLIKIGQIKNIDSTIFKMANKLDKGHPTRFFETAVDLLSESKFNEASFIYYLGLMRYRYFNSVNPDYQASGDGALLASLNYAVGEPINMYLKTDIDNFISIINLTINYYETNDFLFSTKTKNEESYIKQTKGYKDLIIELETNKEKYTTQWDEQKSQMIKNIDLWIEQSKNNNKEVEKGKKRKKNKK